MSDFSKLGKATALGLAFWGASILPSGTLAKDVDTTKLRPTSTHTMQVSGKQSSWLNSVLEVIGPATAQAATPGRTIDVGTPGSQKIEANTAYERLNFFYTFSRTKANKNVSAYYKELTGAQFGAYDQNNQVLVNLQEAGKTTKRLGDTGARTTRNMERRAKTVSRKLDKVFGVDIGGVVDVLGDIKDLTDIGREGTGIIGDIGNSAGELARMGQKAGKRDADNTKILITAYAQAIRQIKEPTVKAYLTKTKTFLQQCANMQSSVGNAKSFNTYDVKAQAAMTDVDTAFYKMYNSYTVNKDTKTITAWNDACRILGIVSTPPTNFNVNVRSVQGR